MAIQVGDKAPDFELKDNHGATVKLSDFRGRKNVVLLFYPFAFTGVCTGELCELRDNLPQFSDRDTQLLAVSNDSIHTLRVFGEQEGLEYPLLSRLLAARQRLARLRRLRRGQGLRRARHLRHRQGGRRALDRRQRPAGRARPERLREGARHPVTPVGRHALDTR